MCPIFLLTQYGPIPHHYKIQFLETKICTRKTQTLNYLSKGTTYIHHSLPTFTSHTYDFNNQHGFKSQLQLMNKPQCMHNT